MAKILIASGQIGLTVAEFRKHVKGLSRCKLTGKNKAGNEVRIVPYHLVDRWLDHKYVDVIWHYCQPTEDQLIKAGESCNVSQ